MSASSTPTFWPEAASAAARLTVTDYLPTPPLPLATAYTWVSEAGWANGISRSTRPPRSRACSSRRCSSLITSRSTATADTPGTAATAAVTSRVMVSRSGQPATVRYTSTLTLPSGAMSTFLTMPRSVIGRRISGSLTRASASVTCAVVGGGVSADELMASCYVAPGPNPGGVGGTVSGPSHTPWSAGGFARGRVQQVGREAGMSPAEHVVQRAGQVVEGRAAGPLPAQPVVLDERQHRGLVGGRAADVVGPGVGRDDQQRQPLAVAAAVLDAAHRRTVPADPGAVERVQRRVGGGVDDRRHEVVVGDHDRGAAPELGPLDRVDRVHQEVLLVDRVGVARVPVLVRGGLEVAHGGQVPLAEGLEEPAQVVLVVGRAAPPDLGHAGRRGVVRVGRGLVVLERVVVRAVVGNGHPADVGVAGAAHRRAARGGAGGGEAALEPAPGDALGVEQVTDVAPAHLDRGVGVVGAAVVERVGVAVDGATPLASGEPTPP